MDRYTDYRTKHVLARFFTAIDLKCIVAILCVELGMLLMAAYKGQGRSYMPVALILMAYTIVGCLIATWAKADKKLFVIIIVLLNLGFMVQQIQDGQQAAISDLLMKLSIALGTAFFVALLYSKIAGWMEKDIVILGMMLLQLLISGAMLLAGQMVGGNGAQGAIISMKGITPFEFVKILYIFVAAGLLCKSTETIRVLKWGINRSVLLAIHTAVLSLLFALCSELGTLLIIYVTALLMLYMFAPRKKWIFVLGIASAAGLLFLWVVCEKLLFPLMLQGRLGLPGIVTKLVRRFGVVFHPESYLNNYGYQGTRGLMAIASGGWLGIGTERHRIGLPEANNDFMFANVIETCGLLIGIVLVVFILAFLKRTMTIAEQCADSYLKGVASGIAVVIVVEAVVHIGYNMAMLPITGIPLYFLSQGFSAIITSMCLVAILQEISTEKRKEA